MRSLLNYALLLSIGILVTTNHAVCQDLTLEFVNSAGSSGYEYASKVTVDKKGNYYFTGRFVNTVDFDPSAATANITAQGINDAFVAKYNSNGDFKWAVRLGGTSTTFSDRGNDVAVDDEGNVYAVGGFYTTGDFDPSANTANLTSSGGIDGYVAKYDSNGNYVWAGKIGGANTVQALGITISESGFLYVCGNAGANTNFDLKGGSYVLAGNGAEDGYMAKYDLDGNIQWAHLLGGSGSGDLAYDIAVDNVGNLAVVGSFRDQTDFDLSANSAIVVAASSYDGFVAKYDTNGAYKWAFGIGGAAEEFVTSVDIDDEGNILVGGQFYSTTDFNGGTGTVNVTSQGGGDLFLAKYDSNGTYQWVFTEGGSLNDRVNDVKVDKNGDYYITGFFEGTLDFDPGANQTNLTGSGSEIFVAKYTNAKELVWAYALGEGGDDEGHGLALDENSNVYITGHYFGTADFDVTSNTNSITTNGGYDMYVAKYSQCLNSISTITIQSCNNYTSPGGKILHATGIYKDTLFGVNYCGKDSIITIDLAIITPDSVVDVQDKCDSLTWIDGNTYTSNNSSANFTLMNAAGCDSVISLDLTIRNATFSSDLRTSCDSLVWLDGNTYTSNNNSATYTLTNSEGCDSTITLDLTILPKSFQTDVQSACDSLVWIDGNTYTTNNNSATHQLTNSAGCDSLVTLDLTILSTSYYTDVRVACDSLVWIDGNSYYDHNNTATFELTNAVGCDSVIMLDLTLGKSSQTIVDTSISSGDVYQVGSNEYSQTGTYKDTLINQENCDSVVITNLSVVSGVGESAFNNHPIKVYPNPVELEMYVDLSALEVATYSLELYNMQGALVRSIENQGNSVIRLETEDLHTGTYLLVIATNKFINRQMINVK